MSGKGGRPPPAPDFRALAREQGRLNEQAARLGAALNRVNQVTPYGTVTFTNQGDRWTQTTQLSPEQQRLLEQSQSTQYDLGQIARLRLGEVGAQGPFSFEGLPERVTSVTPSQFRTDVNAPSVATTQLDTGSLNPFARADLQRSVDLSGVARLPGIDDFAAERQRVEDALYQRGAERLDEQFGRREEQLRTQLLNRGLVEGSEGFNRAMRDLALERQDAFGDLRDRAIAAAGAEQSRLFQNALAGRQQGVSEQFGLGQFANQAAALGADLASRERAQRFGEILSGGQFANQAAQQQFANELARTGLFNEAQGQQFAQGVTNANLTNQAREAGINERLTARDLPLREFLSLYGGGYTPPQLSAPIGQAVTPQPADIYGAGLQQYQSAIDQYNARQARNQQLMQTFGNLIGLFL